MLEFKCTSCNAVLEGCTELYGTEVTCPECGASIQVGTKTKCTLTRTLVYGLLACYSALIAFILYPYVVIDPYRFQHFDNDDYRMYKSLESDVYRAKKALYNFSELTPSIVKDLYQPIHSLTEDIKVLKLEYKQALSNTADIADKIKRETKAVETDNRSKKIKLSRLENSIYAANREIASLSKTIGLQATTVSKALQDVKNRKKAMSTALETANRYSNSYKYKKKTINRLASNAARSLGGSDPRFRNNEEKIRAQALVELHNIGNMHRSALNTYESQNSYLQMASENYNRQLKNLYVLQRKLKEVEAKLAVLISQRKDINAEYSGKTGLPSTINDEYTASLDKAESLLFSIKEKEKTRYDAMKYKDKTMASIEATRKQLEENIALASTLYNDQRNRLKLCVYSSLSVLKLNEARARYYAENNIRDYSSVISGYSLSVNRRANTVRFKLRNTGSKNIVSLIVRVVFLDRHYTPVFSADYKLIETSPSDGPYLWSPDRNNYANNNYIINAVLKPGHIWQIPSGVELPLPFGLPDEYYQGNYFIATVKISFD